MKNTPQSVDEVYNLALRFLTRRALTKIEIRQKLKRKGVSNHLINEVINRLIYNGLIDESALAEDLIQRGRDEKLVGRFYLKYILLGRGISEGLIEKILDKEYPPHLELEVASKFIKKKLSTLKISTYEESETPLKLDQQQIHKLAAALDRRGFCAEVIGEVVHKLAIR